MVNDYNYFYNLHYNIKDNKILENLDTLIHDVHECKNSLELLLFKIGSDQSIDNGLDWPLILNNLRIVSTNLISITKFIKDKKDAKSSIIWPKKISEEIDLSIKVFIILLNCLTYLCLYICMVLDNYSHISINFLI